MSGSLNWHASSSLDELDERDANAVSITFSVDALSEPRSSILQSRHPFDTQLIRENTHTVPGPWIPWICHFPDQPSVRSGCQVLHKTTAGKGNFNTEGFKILTYGGSSRQSVFTGWPAASVAKSITFVMRSLIPRWPPLYPVHQRGVRVPHERRRDWAPGFAGSAGLRGGIGCRARSRPLRTTLARAPGAQDVGFHPTPLFTVWVAAPAWREPLAHPEIAGRDDASQATQLPNRGIFGGVCDLQIVSHHAIRPVPPIRFKPRTAIRVIHPRKPLVGQVPCSADNQNQTSVVGGLQPLRY